MEKMVSCKLTSQALKKNDSIILKICAVSLQLFFNVPFDKLSDFTFMTIAFCILSSDEEHGSERDVCREGKGLQSTIYGDRDAFS
jgi:hypothetical protein